MVRLAGIVAKSHNAGKLALPKKTKTAPAFVRLPGPVAFPSAMTRSLIASLLSLPAVNAFGAANEEVASPERNCHDTWFVGESVLIPANPAPPWKTYTEPLTLKFAAPEAPIIR